MYEVLESRFGSEWLQALTDEMRLFGNKYRQQLDAFTKEGMFPRDIYVEMGQRGWVGPTTATAQGGLGGGVAEYCAICEQVARHSLISPQISVQGQQWLNRWGPPQQQARYLPGIAQGTLIFAEAISEPDAASSLKALTCRAEQSGSEFVINGRKTHVNLGVEADVLLTYAIVPEAGLTAFLVPANAVGMTRRQTDPIGLRLLPTSEITFDNVRVAEDSVLGRVGGGFETFVTTFNVSRLGNASEIIGFSERALRNAIDYAKARPVGSSVVTDFQGNQWIVAEAYSKIYAASLARDRAANLADAGEDVALPTTLAKRLAIEAGEYTVNECYSLIGSHGLYTDTDYGQLLHDMKVYRVAGGSLEILKNYIAKRVLSDDGLLR